jgi:hypothetical protein
MDNNFKENEALYRAVYPPDIKRMYWKDESHISSAVFLDKKGVSVERGNYRPDEIVVLEMKKSFIGKIISITVGLCHKVNAKVLYKPTKRSLYHSEIHGSNKHIILTPAQRRFLAVNSKLV